MRLCGRTVCVILLQDNLSETTVHMMKCMAPSASCTVLRKSEEFWDASRTIEELRRGKYFEGTSEDRSTRTDAKPKDDFSQWPPILRAVVDGGKDGAMALSALGGAIWHTRRALIDHDLLSMKRFGAYIPSDQKYDRDKSLVGDSSSPGNTADNHEKADLPSVSSLPGSSTSVGQQSHMVLDGVALSNLEVLRNSCDGGEKGSLWGFVNRCSTAFGKRLLKDWVMKPLLAPRYGLWEVVKVTFLKVKCLDDERSLAMRKLVAPPGALSALLGSSTPRHSTNYTPDSTEVRLRSPSYLC